MLVELPSGRTLRTEDVRSLEPLPDPTTHQVNFKAAPGAPVTAWVLSQADRDALVQWMGTEAITHPTRGMRLER